MNNQTNPQIVIVLPCSAKQDRKAIPPIPAKDLYQGPVFKYGLELAGRMTCNPQIVILSTRHHLVQPTQLLNSYESPMPKKASALRKWSNKVSGQLAQYNKPGTLFIFLTPKAMYKYLINPKATNFNAAFPLEHFRQFQQQQYLRNLVKANAVPSLNSPQFSNWFSPTKRIL